MIKCAKKMEKKNFQQRFSIILFYFESLSQEKASGQTLIEFVCSIFYEFALSAKKAYLIVWLDTSGYKIKSKFGFSFCFKIFLKDNNILLTFFKSNRFFRSYFQKH